MRAATRTSLCLPSEVKITRKSALREHEEGSEEISFRPREREVIKEKLLAVLLPPPLRPSRFCRADRDNKRSRNGE